MKLKEKVKKIETHLDKIEYAELSKFYLDRESLSKELFEIRLLLREIELKLNVL